MKIKEFILEYEQGASDQELRQQIVGMVKKADRELLDKVYQTLSSGDFDDRILAAVTQDEDAAMIKEKLANIIITTKGTYADKIEYLNQFPSGFIDPKALLAPQSSMAQWFKGSDFARRVFVTVAQTVTPQGVGPGELALASHSPMIKFAGKSRGGGDLIFVGKTAVELKGKVKSWGRLHDARKAKYSIGAIGDALTQLGFKGNRLSLKDFLNLRSSLDAKRRTLLSKIIVTSLFKFVDDSTKQFLIQQLTKNDNADDIKKYWGAASFSNYKATSGFNGILFYDTSTGETRYVKDEKGIINQGLKVDTVYVYSPEQEIMPKIGF